MTNILRDEIERHAGTLGLTGLVEIHDAISQDSDPIQKVNGIYLFGQTKDNQEAVFQSARELLDRGIDAPVYVLNGPDPEDKRFKKSGFPGFAKWSGELKTGYGIDALPLEPFDMNNLNTLSEAQALARLSKESGLDSWYVVAVQFHILRAFIGSASVAIKERPAMNVFAYSGAEQDWNETVVHSQGVVRGTRKDLIGGEMERIQRYTAKGDLEPAERVLEYIAQRVQNCLA